MKIAKWLGILLIVYAGLVAAFEGLLGYMQPENERTMVITTRDDGGEYDRVLSLLASDGKQYVAVNHWPRAWYNRALENPAVKARIDGEQGDYLAVPVAGAEHDRVQADNPTGLMFRIVTGFPPRYFLRLDPQ